MIPNIILVIFLSQILKKEKLQKVKMSFEK